MKGRNKKQRKERVDYRKNKRMENGNKTQKSKERHKEKRKPACTYRYTPIMIRLLTRKGEFSLFQSVPQLWNNLAPYSVANEFSFVGGKMAGYEAVNSPPSSAVGCDCTPTPPYTIVAFTGTTLLSSSFTLADNTFTNN
jgi:hypothetical protein